LSEQHICVCAAAESLPTKSAPDAHYGRMVPVYYFLSVNHPPLDPSFITDPPSPFHAKTMIHRTTRHQPKIASPKSDRSFSCVTNSTVLRSPVNSIHKLVLTHSNSDPTVCFSVPIKVRRRHTSYGGIRVGYRYIRPIKRRSASFQLQADFMAPTPSVESYDPK
jgi:hypothetical protein